MNKKFSTLLAGIALLGAVTANAGTAVTSLKKTGNRLYQLVDKTGARVLAMDKNGQLRAEPLATVTAANISETLWCVEVNDEILGKAPTYDFTNKRHSLRLDIAYAGTDLEGLAKNTPSFSDIANNKTVVGGELSAWAFSPQYAEDLKDRTLYAYFKSDSVLGLQFDALNNMKVVKLGANDAVADAAVGALLTKFELQEPDVIRLDAAAINSYLGMQDAKNGVALTFNPDEMGEKVKVANPFNGKNAGKFFAEDAEPDYVVVRTAKRHYLRVDPSVVNNAGERFLAFYWDDLSATPNAAAALVAINGKTPASHPLLKDQYKFAFSYYPSRDSLIIQVKHAYKYNKITEKVDLPSLPTVLPLGPISGPGSVPGLNNFVTVQDLVKDKVRIVTIYDEKDTDIKLGFAGCDPAASTRTSLPEGLYFIKDRKGRYLASPIHQDSWNLGTTTWVTVNEKEQEPAHMPAYQWVVLKKTTNPKVAGVSPVTVTNREYTAQSSTYQLYKEKGGSYFYLGGKLMGEDSLVFVQVKDDPRVKAVPGLVKEAYTDVNLGYKKVKSVDSLVRTYLFKYLHPYATGENAKFMARLKGQNVLNVLNGKETFRLIDKDPADNTFGYPVTPAIESRVGIVQLQRMEYKIVINEGKKELTLGHAPEDRYAMTAVAPPVVTKYFYLKENNFVDNERFYAILEVLADNIDLKKVGVTDDMLNATVKIQDIDETRTSAFAIYPDETPLYRRFNNTNLGESATDGRDTLRFVETVRKEYLMDENNRAGGLMHSTVNYAGMWTADKATGLGFRVDSVWVTRGLGYIKPQYLISVAHNDYDGFKPDCDCEASIPGFERAKYLVSFADSVAAYGSDKPYTDIQNGYTRVGFVEGVRVKDTLWILPHKLRGVENKAMMASIKKFGVTGNLLSGDNHKNYTWSFRYVYPEKAPYKATEEGNVNKFLFESNNYDGKNIAPENAAWLKIQNGCLVLTDNTSSFASAKTGGDGALIFNVENIADDKLATDNETIVAAEVAVVAEKAAVRVLNAEGKKVVVANILGQTIASTVLTSNDATIVAPAGVVVVSVEGQAAVKAIVK